MTTDQRLAELGIELPAAPAPAPAAAAATPAPTPAPAAAPTPAPTPATGGAAIDRRLIDLRLKDPVFEHDRCSAWAKPGDAQIEALNRCVDLRVGQLECTQVDGVNAPGRSGVCGVRRSLLALRAG